MSSTVTESAAELVPKPSDSNDHRLVLKSWRRWGSCLAVAPQRTPDWCECGAGVYRRRAADTGLRQKMLIDEGFAGSDASGLCQAVIFMLIIGLAMAVGAMIRFYLVSWLGERVSARPASGIQ